MGVVKWIGHIVGPVSNWFAFLAFHINQTNNSWHRAILKIDLEKFKITGKVKGQGHMT